jgi:hypothetical protein
MGPTRNPVRARASADEQEWVDAELVEHVELLEAEVASLETERELLKTELSIAGSWAKELALWLDEAQMRTGGKTLPGMSADDLVGILSPRTVRLLQEKETAPIDRGRLALLSGFALAPWAVLGLLVYVAWLLAS